MSRLGAAAAICGALIALATAPAKALDPHTALAHYGYQSWQTDSGLPQNTVHAIVQGPAGFLWIATEGGLVRFDGVDFSVLTHANTPALPSDLVTDLMVDRSRRIWICTSGGLAVLRGRQLQAFGPAQGIPATQVWRTFQDRRGVVWVLTAAGLFRIEGERAARARLTQDLTENSSMAEGADGSLWLGTAEGLLRGEGGGSFAPAGWSGEVLALAVDGRGTAWAGLRSGDGTELERCIGGTCRRVTLPEAATVRALTVDPRGRLWVATEAGVFSRPSGEEAMWSQHPSSRGAEFLFCDRQGAVWVGTAQGLLRFTDGGAKEQVRRTHDLLLSAAEDREGDLWLGTEAGGLAVLRDRKFSTLTSEDGLTDQYVLALAQAPNGTVWAGTKNGGVDVIRGASVRAMTAAQGLASNVVLTVAAARNGDAWVGTPDGLNRIHDGQVRLFTTADGLGDDFVRSLEAGQRGELWIGTRHGLSRYENGQFTTWTAADGLGSDLVGAMAEGPAGTLWIGTLGGLTEFRDGQFRNFTTEDGLSSNVVTALREDADGTLWIGTNDGGLNRMRGGKIVSLRNPMLPERVIGILEDGSGYLWISSNHGVYRVSRAGLNRLADGGAAPEVMRFGVTDGMRISECSSGGHPAAVQLQDGALWFATLKGIAEVDPEHMPLNRVPPPVVLEGVKVDDVPEPGGRPLTIAPGHSHYEFDYAGLSFVAPEKVEYRYRLDGFDRGWVNAGTRRTAYYTNLPHGRYRFEVLARNNDGVWSRAAATTEMRIEPHLYQTLWFRLLILLALAGLAWTIWRRRLRGVEREFQAVLGERTRIAREIHDTLAQGFVAVSVQLELVAQLMQSSTAAARDQLTRAQALVRTSLEEARSSIWELRSQGTERKDLAAYLLQMAEEVVGRVQGADGGAAQRKAARVQMQVRGAYHPLDAELEREVTRIAREAVVNAVRHGNPENILLRLEFEGSIFEMEIRDDGKGFAEAPPGATNGHYGLTGMRERARAMRGRLTVESRPGAGTRVQLAVPLDGEREKKL